MRDVVENRNALARIVGDEAGRVQLARILRAAKELHESTSEAVRQAKRTEDRLGRVLRGGQDRNAGLP